MEPDEDAHPTYVPIAGTRFARTPEERAEVFSGLPDRIVELRLRGSSSALTPEEHAELRLMEDILARSAPELLPPD